MNDDFLITKEYRRFAEFCDACRQYRYIGVCHGRPGVGKTLSACYYSNWDTLQIIFNNKFRDKRETIEPGPEVADARSIFYTAPVAASSNRIEEGICSARYDLSYALEWAKSVRNGEPDFDVLHLFDPTELIIVDEADRLKMAGLEQLRDIYDRGNLGLILIGMPGLEKRLARYPQLYSRVGFVHEYRALSTEELRFIMEHKWADLGLNFQPNDFTDTEAMTTIARITGGNFRLIQRLFTQIQRILEINNLHTITKEVVETARQSLIIGS
jgi:DNA transposition AAA+ family ATPase